MPHVHAAGPGGFAAWTLMWFGMMAAMMAPAAWPWIRSFHRFRGPGSAPGIATTGQFAGGYLVAWLGYSMAAALLQQTLLSAGLLDPMAGTPSRVGAGLFLIAGLYQFAPLKRACLTHCRSPFAYFLARWQNGPAGGFRMGLGHGLYCIGCCWALMATALAVGVMNVWWMAALAAVAFLEQVMPWGHDLRRPLGVALLAAGLSSIP